VKSPEELFDSGTAYAVLMAAMAKHKHGYNEAETCFLLPLAYEHMLTLQRKEQIADWHRSAGREEAMLDFMDDSAN
jgi:hypothetical protein